MAIKNYYQVLFTKGRLGKYPEVQPKDKPGYSLSSAKDYALIASRTGDPTEVYRVGKGGKRGKMVRRYVKGKRDWPFVPADLKKFKESEVPKTMMRYWEEMKAGKKPTKKSAVKKTVKGTKKTATRQPHSGGKLPLGTPETIWVYHALDRLKRAPDQMLPVGEGVFGLGISPWEAQHLVRQGLTHRVDTRSGPGVSLTKKGAARLAAMRPEYLAAREAAQRRYLGRENRGRPNPRIGTGRTIKITAKLNKQGVLTLVPYGGQQEQFYKEALAKVLNVAVTTLMRKPLLTIPKDNVKTALSALMQVGMSDRKARELELSGQATFKIAAAEYESWIDKAYKVNIFPPNGKLSEAKKNPRRKGPTSRRLRRNCLGICNPAGSAQERKLSPRQRKGFADALRYTYGEQQGEFSVGQRVKYAKKPYLVLEVSETSPAGEHFYTLISPGLDKVLPTVSGGAIEGRRVKGRKRSPWSLWGRNNPAPKGKKKPSVKIRVLSAEGDAVPTGTHPLAQARELFWRASTPRSGYNKVNYEILKGRKAIFSGRADISRTMSPSERDPINHARESAEWVLSPKGKNFYYKYDRKKEYAEISAGAKALLRELKGL